MSDVEVVYRVCLKVNNFPVDMFRTPSYDDAKEFMEQFSKVFCDSVFMIFKVETTTNLVDWQEEEDEKSFVAKYEYTEQELEAVNDGMRRDNLVKKDC